ncbi:hypothetical protein HMPREF1871_00002 [Gemelliphila asaccharolytica]|uniref:Uncharacterized protein n=1 Tax=Gemelliphila asaccharolytica TaxID=502393 RepID=A0ABR5TND8_9BACL|nr:hypothetical protein HMPREF1871_00002 [Gemella asaccharolytica]
MLNFINELYYALLAVYIKFSKNIFLFFEKEFIIIKIPTTKQVFFIFCVDISFFLFYIFKLIVK